MEQFKNIRLTGWRQFDEVDLDLDYPLCVLTGPNGCGKTTILNVLGRHFGWNIHFISTPFVSTKKERKFWSDVWAARAGDTAVDVAQVPVGSITYTSGEKCQLSAPSRNTTSGQYNLKYQGQQSVVGLHIPSHRPTSSYANIEHIPVDPKTSQQQFEEFRQLLFQTYGSDSVRNPGVVLKRSLIALALFGEGNQHVSPNPEYRALFEGFEAILSAILPREIGFHRLEVRMPEIVLITRSGDFPLDAMSGGVSAIFGIAWQIHMYGADKDNCTVLIDEPENHLHPSMQRSFLPSLIRAFPKYRFIASTHSPFIVSSSPDAAVFALTFNERNRITSHRITEVELAASPNKILQEVLDVPTTVPEWVEARIVSVLEKYRDRQGDPTAADQIFEEIKQMGLERVFGSYLSRKE